MRQKLLFILVILILFIIIIPVKAQEDNGLENQYSPFSGMPVDERILQKAIMAVIENSPQSRPQSGLNDAAIIYEFLVEGGITRFLSLYWETVPDKIGPIRSARPYFVEIANSYKALLLHAGASPEGFARIEELNIDNLDQIYNGNYYWRGSQRETPHNLYTGYFKIQNYLEELTGQEYETRFDFQNISFVSSEDMDAEKINIRYTKDYQVKYEYQSQENNYLRYLNDYDNPHMSSREEQLKASNIIIQFVNTERQDDEGRLKMEILGEGAALILKDGVAIEGRWVKENNEWTKYYDVDYNRVELNPGKTWIQVVPVSTQVDIKGSQESDLSE
ncbi:MAG: DUF3048 domain-containing protein [Halanaerobiales bacterium]